MALTPQEERERKNRISRGETGVNPRLDYLNRKKTSTMSESELRKAAKRYPGGQADQELIQRDC